MLKVYLQLLKKTATRSFYAAYMMGTDGTLTNLWPLDSSDEKAARREGFYYASSDRVCGVAYSFMADEIGTRHDKIVMDQIQTVLRNRGLDVTGLEIYQLNGVKPQRQN